MKCHRIGTLVALGLTIVGCGSDSPSEEVQYKDAAADSKDAPAAASDVLVTADARDAVAPSADVVGTADTKDAPTITDDAAKPQPDALEVPADASEAIADARIADLAGTFDSTFDSMVERPSLDTSAPEAAIDSSAVVGFPCRNDSDCCIEIDSCMNVAYLYSKAPGAAAPYAIQPPPGGMCTACIPPTIQVHCVSGQCTGERVAGYPSSLMSSHCGYVALPDGGLTALQDVIDAGSVSTKSVWTCSGG